MNQHASLEELQAYAEGTSPNAHIDSCDVCRAHLARLAAIDDAVRSLPQLQPPPFQFSSVRSFGPRRGWLPARPVTQLLAAALACVVLFAAGLLTGIRLDRVEPVNLPKHVPGDSTPATPRTGEFAGARLIEQNGLTIVSVAEGTPAAALGLQPGDIIFAADGIPLRALRDLDALRGSATIRLEWSRPEVQRQSGVLQLNQNQ